ncbi:M23 family metallopeptidase [Allopontixanthobacter sp.]|uniref:M23 family metallopeptidase n=1 Tax=Allopontixanthobacter sp. TaxID=2906452 RepID=UPI002ABB6CA1|nr:M23 family metallopeptidase [Allopontixanthobacter sp.]MDZ4307460.1 M23 family metallopeptidase [Allopontixanthobacter sp.]
MRSQGQVRFIKISSKLQMIAAGTALAALLAWTVSMALMGWAQYRAQADISSLLQREAKVARSEERVTAYRSDLGAVTDDLTKRQAFIEAMVSSLPADTKTARPEGDTVSDSTSEAAQTVSKVSALIPEAAALARIEARQLAFVERLTRYADLRSDRAVAAIRKLGLDPGVMLRSAERSAMGGPLELLSTGADGDIDPRFERLGLSLARMTALERGLDGLPQVMPARVENITSGFGFRRDPFTGRGAMHAGLDFRGQTGAPIHAAANGRVSFVGQKSGYGKVVEVRHGNGLLTRYAHMSRYAAKVGQQVSAGDVIGAIGSTGRSTGPHLHFEVRINNRAVNPRPFLEYAPDVLKEVRSGT